jgi:hypothetical protein
MLPLARFNVFRESERERKIALLRRLIVVREVATTRRFWCLNRTFHLVYFLNGPFTA